MKNCISALFVLSVILVVVSCGDKEPDILVGKKNEVYITAGLKVRPLTDVKFESTPQRIARGKYLAEGASHCFLCHSPRDWSKPGAPPIETKKGSGAILENEKDLMMVAPNITPDEETGAGNWTDDMFARAIREGVGHDGRALYPLMLYYEFKYFSDEDLASVVVYLRTLPPVKNKLPKRNLPEQVQQWIVHLPRPIYKPVPEPDFSNVMERGKYMTQISGCVGCHTAWESPLKPGLFAGGMLLPEPNDSAYSVNITPDQSGLFYNEDAFIDVIRTGKGGTLHSVMPWIVIKNYTDEDLRAIYRYLKTTAPVRHYINNIDKPTYCKLCGGTHGSGERNAVKIINVVKVKPAVYNEYAGTYTSDEGDSLTVFRNGDSLMVKNEVEGVTAKLLPISSTEFASYTLPFNFKFTRNIENKVTALSYHLYDDVECKKVK
jgi:mono/diheme cytochrome c family protein